MKESIPYYDFVKKLFNRSGDPSKDFTHAILGIVTEIHEYLSAPDDINGLEELGDLEFYLVALHQVIEDYTKCPYAVPDTEITLKHMLAGAHEVGIPTVISGVCNELLDIAKRWVGYNKEPKSMSEVLKVVSALITFVNNAGPFPNPDVDRIRAVNMAKLLKRYPGGEFDAYRAVVRDLEAERVVLQTS